MKNNCKLLILGVICLIIINIIFVGAAFKIFQKSEKKIIVEFLGYERIDNKHFYKFKSNEKFFPSNNIIISLISNNEAKKITINNETFQFGENKINVLIIISHDNNNNFLKIIIEATKPIYTINPLINHKDNIDEKMLSSINEYQYFFLLVNYYNNLVVQGRYHDIYDYSVTYHVNNITYNNKMKNFTHLNIVYNNYLNETYFINEIGFLLLNDNIIIINKKDNYVLLVENKTIYDYIIFY